MSEAHGSEPILSREELAALLGALDDARREQAGRERVFRRDEGRAAAARRELRRALDRFAAEYGKALSSHHQTRIEVAGAGFDEVASEEAAESLLAMDRVLAFEVEPEGEPGFAWMSRPLWLPWMTLSLGGRPRAASPEQLGRAPTRLEQRFLQRTLSEALGWLEQAFGSDAPRRFRPVGMDDVAALRDAGRERWALASFDVKGFPDIGRLRFALPTALFGAAPARTARDAGAAALARGSLLDMPVTMRAEAGRAELPLSRLSALRPGDVIPLEGDGPNTLVLRVGSAAKFRGERGSVGRRIAVRIVERVKDEGEQTDGNEQRA